MQTTDKTLNKAIIILLRTVHLDELWSIKGPSLAALDIATTGGAGVSNGARLMMQAALDLYGGAGGTDLHALATTLDRDRLRMVTGLMNAMVDGDRGIETWIDFQLSSPEARRRAVVQQFASLAHAEMG